MARWEPDARGRLLHAAIELFSARGYDATTAAQIAEQAGLTKTTLFRLFADKREILFQGQNELIAAAVDGVETSPADSSPFQVLRAAVIALCVIHTADRKDTGARLDIIISTSQELQERAVFKRSAITSALHSALTARLDDAREAGILADLGIRAYYDGFATWITSTEYGPLADFVSNELLAYQSALGNMGIRSPDLSGTRR